MVRAGADDLAERPHAIERVVRFGPDAVPVPEQLPEHQGPPVRALAPVGADRLGEVTAPPVPVIRRQLRRQQDARLRHEAIVALARVAPRDVPAFPAVGAAFEVRGLAEQEPRRGHSQINPSCCVNGRAGGIKPPARCASERVGSARWKSWPGFGLDPVAEGNCGFVRGRGEQPEANE